MSVSSKKSVNLLLTSVTSKKSENLLLTDQYQIVRKFSAGVNCLPFISSPEPKPHKVSL